MYNLDQESPEIPLCICVKVAVPKKIGVLQRKCCSACAFLLSYPDFLLFPKVQAIILNFQQGYL